jgi:hypothetical protein
MTDDMPQQSSIAELQLAVEELKKALRDTVFESGRQKSAILGAPRKDYKWPDLFVLMPFSAQLEPVYKDHIQVVAQRAELTVDRADNFFSSGAIMGDVWSAINAAKVIVADCTGRNPNVMYEIGLAHAIGRHTILISQSIDDVPFDLRHLRVIVYDYTPRGMTEFEMKLAETIDRSTQLSTNASA